MILCRSRVPWRRRTAVVRRRWGCVTIFFWACAPAVSAADQMGDFGTVLQNALSQPYRPPHVAPCRPGAKGTGPNTAPPSERTEGRRTSAEADRPCTGFCP